ncbi:2-methylcitrate dehydratase [Azoarcus sp. Aa7]|nr:2-methylcitrate dehydratase [Azoarcus sp. Aa7]
MNAPKSPADALIAPVLAKFAADLDYDAIPAEVRERAKYLILDAVGIAHASTRYDFAHRSLSAVSELGRGDADVIGLSAKLTLRDAVLMNGILVHGLDYDDTHARGVIHATASCFPTALGVAAQAALSGRELLAAYIVGMEVATRLGSVAKGGFHQTGFHPTGLIGTFACALIAGRLHGMNADQLAMAQGIALSVASGSLEFLQDGAWTKRMHPGWAGVAGITAATLAKHGFVGPKAAYEGRFGLFNSHLGPLAENCDYTLATAGLGEAWEVGQVAVKPLPACHFTHSCADSAMAIAREHKFRPEDIEKVRALIPAEVVKTVCEPVANKQKPQNSYDAQFSIPYAVASGLLRGRFGLAELEDSALSEADVLAVAGKVAYEVDPNSAFPQYYSGEVIVTLRDGREFSHREHVNRGAADRPITNDEIVEKYMENACLAVSPQRARQIRDAVLALDEMPAGTFSDALAAQA